MSTDLVKCPSCGTCTYATTKGAVRKHYVKGDYRKPDRAFCPGSGQPGTPVERTR